MTISTIYDGARITSPEWWREETAVLPLSLRGRLVRAYVRLAVAFASKVNTPARLLSPEFDWRRARQGLIRLERLPAVYPRDVHREMAVLGNVRGEWFAADRPEEESRTLLYVHGGSYVFPRSPLHDVLAANLARDSHARVMALDYRLAPEEPFPCAIDDVVAAYRSLLENGKTAEQIGFAADSAGCGLALAALIVLRDAGDPLPSALACLSPWADLTFSGASIIDNANQDPYMSNLDFVSVFAELYLQGLPPTADLASPALADLHDMPNTLVHVGSTDLLLDDAKRIVENIRKAGGCARIDVWSEMPHVWQRMKAFCPEAECSLASIGQFFKRTVKTKDWVA